MFLSDLCSYNTFCKSQVLPIEKSPKIQSRTTLPTVEEDCNDQNIVVDRLKLKMHALTVVGEEEEEEEEKKGEEKRAL